MTLKVSFVCGLIKISLERNDLWPGSGRIVASGAWILVVAVRRFP
ncbi:hypothetical protein [Streptomyces fodineus]|nr:hypothetical protein [Streptomyces fodineus]